ncbi:FAD:protein FMN transferase [Kineosporia sp. NBRC 101731]|uniref:FAD:protein FMN transferase n=1 Tax=Kineosporia sp. NBRC 101731 TaxID=3032199 RepID=UPI0024A5494B|nr:FAD:protein FMN transferase [Kineosporia sp. NBRC 101731]GLY33825.1 FAD:protein FMN transferase [Kineosporia sp. NBRC 101731]
MTTTSAPAVHAEPCMGTVFSFRITGRGLATGSLEQALARIHAIDAMFSTYREDSQISRLRSGDLRLPDASPDVRRVLQECERLEHLTDGYFSARPDGDHLDPSGYVKGWAVQEASGILAAAGSRDHCVNGGGDVLCLGAPEPGRGWRVGISDPHDSSRLLETLEATGPVAVATSGTAQRGAHILDPHTGRRRTELASVTVIAPDIVTADVYATAAVAMGPRRAGEWLAGQAGIRAVLVLADGRRTDIPG